MAELLLEHLSCQYRNAGELVQAVDDLSLEARDGELLVLVGPSGCGKTTTLRLIAGLERPCAGVVRIGPQVVNDVPARGRDVAMVFQNHALYPHLTVYDNLAFGLRSRRMAEKEVEAAVRETASRLELTDVLRRKPEALSGGQQQRTALGRAMVRRPAVFLLDEPLSNLDPSLRAHARNQIKSIQRESKTTMLYVTHDQEEAMCLGDRIAVMKCGRLELVGTPTEIFERPVNVFVAGFFGSPSMNFVHGRIEQENAQACFVSGNFRVAAGSNVVAGLNAAGGVVLGIRPFDVVLPGAEHSGIDSEVWYDACVRGIEYLGDARIIRLELACGISLTAKAPVQLALAVGGQTRIRFRRDHFLYFEGNDEGRRLK